MKKKSWSLSGLKKSKSKKPSKKEILRKKIIIYFSFISFFLFFFFLVFINFLYLNFLKIFNLSPKNNKVAKKTIKSPLKKPSLNYFFYFFTSFSLVFLLFFQINIFKQNLIDKIIIKQNQKNERFNLSPNLLINLPNDSGFKIKLEKAESELQKINQFLEKQPHDPQLLKNKIIISQYLKNSKQAEKTYQELKNLSN